MIPGYSLGPTLARSATTVLRRGERQADGLPVLLRLPLGGRLAEAGRADIWREAEVTQAWDDSGILLPIALEEAGPSPALVYEDPGGRPLGVRDLESGRDVAWTLRAFLAAVGAVESLHARKLVHRRIEPGSLLVDPDGSRAWLTNLGRVSAPGQRVESPFRADGAGEHLAWLAPEQTGRVSQPVDRRTDLYALGILLYQQLSGRPPFVASDAVGWLHRILALRPRPLAQRDAAIPEPLSRLVQRLLAKSPWDRYQTAFGLRMDLAQCLGNWEADATIQDFSLGLYDIPERVRIPARLYGRGAALEMLQSLVERAVGGTTELALIAGAAGVGKSALVRQLRRTIPGGRTVFLEGKGDPFARNIPFDVLSQVLAALVRRILSEDERRVARWRERLHAAVGASGQVLVELDPDIELLLGPQPAVPSLPPDQSRNRLSVIFRRFVQACAGPDHPLVVFLDDLHWVDADTLVLLGEILSSSGTGHLLLIGAYRDDEVGPDHPLATALESYRTRGVEAHSWVLQGLDEGVVEVLLRDTFRRNDEKVRPLAGLLVEKTGGNPFFLAEFLREAEIRGHVRLDPAARRWSWDLDAVSAVPVAHNVVELMIARIAALPTGARDALQVGACLGGTFDLVTLALAQGRGEVDAAVDLWSAVEAGLLRTVPGAPGRGKKNGAGRRYLSFSP